MASPPVLDFDQLLRPISDERPGGVELKNDSAASALYYQVKDARDAARTAERQLFQAAWLNDQHDAKPSPPDWTKVRELATDILATRSKDLWVAAWLIEALCRLEGFAGLRDGFRLTHELVAKYWEGIHPAPDEEGYATTVAQLSGLNGAEAEGALLAPIDRIPITAEGPQGELTSADYRVASELEQLTDPDRRTQRIEAGAVTLSVFEKTVDKTPPEFFRGLVEDIQQALDEFTSLNVLLEEKCGNQPDGTSAAPPSTAIRGALQACLDRVNSLARHLLHPDAPPVEDDANKLVEVRGDGNVPSAKGKGMTREDAFRALLQVADYFRKTEPHSPVSYALEQAVRWGRMSLPELLTELISDSNAREDLFRRAGIPAPEQTES